jgi:type VI secretion system secreted protein Hcp
MEISNLNKKLTGAIVFAVLAVTIVVGMNQLAIADNSSNNDTEIQTDVEQTSAIYMRLTGESQGEIKGDVTAAGYEDSIEILSFNHAVVSPRDAATGLPTGKRQHKPITVTKPLDKASPLLMNILVHNENVVDASFDFLTVGRTGATEHYYTIELVNAAISSIRTVLVEDPDTGALMTYEQVSFVYQKIIWTFEDGGITAEDDWETPVA